MTTTWHTAETARTDLGITVSDRQLAAAREQCLRIKGLSLSTPIPPSESFAQGVVYQALANKQASQASAGGELGGETSRVNVTPLDGKIMSMLIIPAPSGGSIDPITLTWPNGATGTLSRIGDTVSLAVTVPRAAPPATLPFPTGFVPANNVMIQIPASAGGGGGVILDPTDSIGLGVGITAIGSADEAFTVATKYLADPVEGTGDGYDLGFVGTLVG